MKRLLLVMSTKVCYMHCRWINQLVVIMVIVFLCFLHNFILHLVQIFLKARKIIPLLLALGQRRVCCLSRSIHEVNTLSLISQNTLASIAMPNFVTVLMVFKIVGL